MGEELFWVIYFTLVKTLLPPEAFEKPSITAPAAAAGASGGGGSSAGAALSNSGADAPVRIVQGCNGLSGFTKFCPCPQ